MTESFGWVFVDFIPLLYEKRKVARQLQIETWLDLSQLVKELGMEKTLENKQGRQISISYVV